MGKSKIVSIMFILVLLGLAMGSIYYNQRTRKELELSIIGNKYLYVQGLEIKKVD